MIALGRSHETSIIREGENFNIEDYGFAPNAWHSENGGFPVKGAGPLGRRSGSTLLPQSSIMPRDFRFSLCPLPKH